MPKSDSRPAWRLRRFFISSVKDAVLERSAALEALCYGIGFGRLGRRPIFYCFTYVCYVIQTRLDPSSLLEERSETPIVFVCFFCVVGYPPNWGKRPRYIDR